MRRDGGYGVLVLKGEVTVQTRRGVVTLREGQGTMVYAKDGPSQAAPWPEDRTKRAVASISFDPNRLAASTARARYLSDGIMRKP